VSGPVLEDLAEGVFPGLSAYRGLVAAALFLYPVILLKSFSSGHSLRFSFFPPLTLVCCFHFVLTVFFPAPSFYITVTLLKVDPGAVVMRSFVGALVRCAGLRVSCREHV